MGIATQYLKSPSRKLLWAMPRSSLGWETPSGESSGHATRSRSVSERDTPVACGGKPSCSTGLTACRTSLHPTICGLIHMHSDFCGGTLKEKRLHNQIAVQQSSIICQIPQTFEANHSIVLPQTHS